MANEQLIKLIEQVGDKSLQQHIPLTSEMIARELANNGVAPVRRGRWLDVKETDYYVADYKITTTKTAETCSECKVRIGFIGAKEFLFDGFCPNCGERMDGGGDDD